MSKLVHIVFVAFVLSACGAEMELDNVGLWEIEEEQGLVTSMTPVEERRKSKNVTQSNKKESKKDAEKDGPNPKKGNRKESKKDEEKEMISTTVGR